MGKYTGKFEDIIEDRMNEDEDIYANEESKYWIHRTKNVPIYINVNYKSNGCPLLLTEQEIEEYVGKGKDIKDCSSVSLFYSDNEEKSRVEEKLKESGITEDIFELQVNKKILEMNKSYFEEGVYMPDAYGTDIERTASQLSVKKMKRAISIPNFGFNGYRGEMNVGIILEIPLDQQEKVCEQLPNPIEYGTEYYGVAKISRVISPKYIKGLVAKFGNEVFYIINPNFVKQQELESMFNHDEHEQYLYHIEELFSKAAQEFMDSTAPNQERVLAYKDRVEQIEKEFRKAAVTTTGFVGSERYKQVVEYLKATPRIVAFTPDETKGNGINMVMEKRYYDDVATSLATSFDKENGSKEI